MNHPDTAQTLLTEISENECTTLKEDSKTEEPVVTKSTGDSLGQIEEESHGSHNHNTLKKSTAVLMVSALGIVFGDIGTSPLYTFKECLKAVGPLTQNSVYGILSLIVWSILLVVTFKYVLFVMRADNDGEGGIMALMSLVNNVVSKKTRAIITTLGLFGAAMFYGDSMITPAISVLSAVEGLALISPGFTHAVLPIAVVILIALFIAQKKGTEVIGALFGPTMLIWFTVIAVLGLTHVVAHPAILQAISPAYAALFIWQSPTLAFVVLASVFLALTGGEALFADMGHFGKKPIARAWLYIAFPALVLNYFGQGVLVLQDQTAIKNPFFLLAPSWALLPLVLLATFATIIASQAVISGAFSMTKQAIQLGYLPRIITVQTSFKEIGQVYVPFINNILFVCIVFLVLFFKSSDNLASAYGVAVASTMMLTTVFMFFVTRLLWKWSVWLSLVVTGILLSVDLVFLAANLGKVVDGGWFPLAAGMVIFTLMTTWKRGRKIVYDHVRSNDLELPSFVAQLFGESHQQAFSYSVTRVAGTAVFMNRNGMVVPSSFTHNLMHNKVLHEHTFFLEIAILKVPVAEDADKMQVTDLGRGCYAIKASLGFKETPDVPALLKLLNSTVPGWDYNPMEVSYFLTRQTIIAEGHKGNMTLWRERLFALLSRNAAKAADYFHIPANRVVEIGSQVNI